MGSNHEQEHSNRYGIFRTIWVLLLRVQSTVLILTSLLVAVGTSSMVIAKYFFNYNMFGMDEIVILCAFWIYFIGASYGTYDRSHIVADIVSVYVKNIKVRLCLKTITSIVTLLICFLFTYWAVGFFIWSYGTGARTSALHMPVILLQSAIPFGYLMMSFYLIVNLVQDTKKLFNALKNAD